MSNRHNSFESCENCPNRKLGCRSTCKGWAYREEKKKERYAKKDLARKSHYVSAHYERSLIELAKSGKKGNSVGGYKL